MVETSGHKPGMFVTGLSPFRARKTISNFTSAKSIRNLAHNNKLPESGQKVNGSNGTSVVHHYSNGSLSTLPVTTG